jgi:hypothetical protein
MNIAEKKNTNPKYINCDNFICMLDDISYVVLCWWNYASNMDFLPK